MPRARCTREKFVPYHVCRLVPAAENLYQDRSARLVAQVLSRPRSGTENRIHSLYSTPHLRLTITASWPPFTFFDTPQDVKGRALVLNTKELMLRPDSCTYPSPFIRPQLMFSSRFVHLDIMSSFTTVLTAIYGAQI
ncbi:hypothetical protein FRC12_005756 [Ceratobasidium sp. 428]|nr:hypothetical protein FRC09_000535 [Ceratobasidium sp. 395]KAG8768121.1 hypothetical protein FRC12_005756 [Ceratobasidium sp. 428]